MNAPVTDRPSQQTALRIGCVSFLNAKPLIYGLEAEPKLTMNLDVPASLAAMLQSAAVDVALLPVIDYQRLPGLRLIPAGGIASDGHTLTVRIFSRQPIESIATLGCDPDSHTSVALARVIMAERYGIRPDLRDLRDSSLPKDAARLLIGDKVITDEPAGFDHQLDLGFAWKELTGLPFVFAAWMARPGAELGDWPARLERAKREGLANIGPILRQHAITRGWPIDTARRYLTDILEYDITPRHIEAIERFYQLAAKHGVIDTPVRELVTAQ
jgi:chorismate dehydratase